MAPLPRIVIYVKDIQCIKGCGERTARRQMRTIRKRLGKEKHQDISVLEYCMYTGLPVEEVREFLK